MAKRKLTLADFTGPNNINTPDPSNSYGIADRDALQAFAWNQDYDVDARRNAIAAALLAKQVAAPGAAAAPTPDQLTAMPGDPRLGGSGDYGMGSGDSAAPTGQTPGNVTQQGFFENATPERSFTQGQPPGPTMFGRDRESAPPGSREEDATVADIMDQVAQANAIAQAMSTTTATPTPAGGREGATPAPTPSGGREGAPSAPAPSAQGWGSPIDSFTATAPPSGNMFEPGTVFDMTSPDPMSGGGRAPGATPTGGFPGEHSDIPGATPSGGYTTSPTGDPLGAKSTSTTSFTAPAGFPGGPFGGRGGPGREGQGEKEASDPNDPADPNAPDFDRSFDSVAAPAAAMAVGVPSFDPGAMAQAGMSMAAQGFNAGPSATGKSGGATGSTASNAFGMPTSGFTAFGSPGYTSPGLPSSGGGVFSPGFSFTAPAPAAEMDFGSTPAFDSMGNPTGWGGDTNAGAVDLGDLDGGTGDVTDGGGGQGFGGGGAAGGAAGFGGMGPGGGVGGMSTGGTGEIGSVAGGGPSGTGGMAGAGMGGGIDMGMGGPGGFSGAGPGQGMSEGAAQAAADAAQGAADMAAGSGDFSGGDGNDGGGSDY